MSASVSEPAAGLASASCPFRRSCNSAQSTCRSQKARPLLANASIPKHILSKGHAWIKLSRVFQRLHFLSPSSLLALSDKVGVHLNQPLLGGTWYPKTRTSPRQGSLSFSFQSCNCLAVFIETPTFRGSNKGHGGSPAFVFGLPIVFWLPPLSNFDTKTNESTSLFSLFGLALWV